VKRFVEMLRLPLLGKARRFAAVDFDSACLRVVLVELVAAGTRITSAISRAIPDGLDVTQGEALGKLLAATLKDLRFRGGGVVMSVPRSQAVLKPISLPPGTPREDLAGMVYYQVGRELPFPTEDAVMDFAIERPDARAADVPVEEREISVLVAAIRLGTVDYYRRLAAAAGVKLLRLGLRPYANMRCVQVSEPTAKDEDLAVVHVTADETEIDLLSGDRLALSRSVVKNISALAQPDRFGVPEALKELVTEIARTLQSYQAMERGARVGLVLLAGQTGIESRVAELLTARLGVTCRMLAPQQALAAGSGRIGSEFISAMGLAAGHPAAREFPFDFLHPKRPPEKRDVKKLRIAGIAVAAVVLLAAAVGARAVYLGGKRDVVAALRKEDKALEQTLNAVRKEAARVAAIEQWSRAGRNWLDELARLSCLFPSAKDVYLTGLTTGADGSVSLKIQGRTSEAITELGKRLGEAGYKVKPDAIKTGKDTYGYVYSSTVRILEFPPGPTDLAALKPAPRPEDDSTPEQFNRSVSKGRAGGRANR